VEMRGYALVCVCVCARVWLGARLRDWVCERARGCACVRTWVRGPAGVCVCGYGCVNPSPQISLQVITEGPPLLRPGYAY